VLLGGQHLVWKVFREGPIGRLFDRQAAQTTKDAGSNIVRGGGADISTVDTG
jgi:hypothetical protein